MNYKNNNKMFHHIKQEPDRKISEVMVGGEMVDPNVVSAIMTAVPTLVALGAAINWKEEIAAWVRQMKAKYAK
jgi:putative N-acetylmannosamine-6-phosphate epimerase